MNNKRYVTVLYTECYCCGSNVSHLPCTVEVVIEDNASEQVIKDYDLGYMTTELFDYVSEKSLINDPTAILSMIAGRTLRGLEE